MVNTYLPGEIGIANTGFTEYVDLFPATNLTNAGGIIPLLGTSVDCKGCELLEGTVGGLAAARVSDRQLVRFDGTEASRVLGNLPGTRGPAKPARLDFPGNSCRRIASALAEGERVLILASQRARRHQHGKCRMVQTS